MAASSREPARRSTQPDPSLRRRQRPHGTSPDPPGPAPARARTARPAARFPHPRDLVAGLRRRPDGYAPCRPAELCRGTCRDQPLDSTISPGRAGGRCRRAVQDASRFEEQVRTLQSSWIERAGHPRRDSAARLLIEKLPAAPMLTTSTATTLIDRSFQAASQAMDRLVRTGVLRQAGVGRRHRAFEASELIEAFTALERPASAASRRRPRRAARPHR